MKFIETAVAGAFRIELEPIADERGFFARSFCVKEFAAHGLETRIAQCNISSNRKKGTVRGMHWQAVPWQEAKLVRCIRGALFDVVLDIRPNSPTRGTWTGIELTAENRTALYIPPGCAHGFQTLEDDTDIFYQMSELYAPEHARGLRFDDPEIGIEWPLPVTSVSEKDRSWLER